MIELGADMGTVTGLVKVMMLSVTRLVKARLDAKPFQPTFELKKKSFLYKI